MKPSHGLSPCDLVLVEGYKAQPIPKLEVWRPSVRQAAPALRSIRHVRGVATDTPGAFRDARLPVFRLDAIDEIATFVLAEATDRSVSD